jgi:hypothetical protein
MTDEPTLFDPPDPVTDEDETEDLAAETDTSVPSDAADTDDYEPSEPDYTGVCRGGPVDGMTMPCRFPGGFLLYDKARSLMWTYTASAMQPGEYTALTSGPITLSSLDALREAAEGAQLDVIAYDGPVLT